VEEASKIEAVVGGLVTRTNYPYSLRQNTKVTSAVGSPLSLPIGTKMATNQWEQDLKSKTQRDQRNWTPRTKHLPNH